jgi:hypothetical protein
VVITLAIYATKNSNTNSNGKITMFKLVSKLVILVLFWVCELTITFNASIIRRKITTKKLLLIKSPRTTELTPEVAMVVLK